MFALQVVTGRQDYPCRFSLQRTISQGLASNTPRWYLCMVRGHSKMSLKGSQIVITVNICSISGSLPGDTLWSKWIIAIALDMVASLGKMSPTGWVNMKPKISSMDSIGLPKMGIMWIVTGLESMEEVMGALWLCTLQRLNLIIFMQLLHCAR